MFYDWYVMLSTGMSVTLKNIGYVPLLLLFSLISTSADMVSSNQLTLPNNELVKPVLPKKEGIISRSGIYGLLNPTGDMARLIRLENELESKQTPTEVAEIFIKIVKMEIKLKKEESLRFTYFTNLPFNQLKEEVRDLKRIAKKKLEELMDEDVDNLLKDLTEFEAQPIDEVTEKKVWDLEKKLREIKFELKELSNVDDLERVKSKVVDVVVGLKDILNQE